MQPTRKYNSADYISSLSEVIMNNSFEQLKLMVSELSLDKKHLLVKLLNGQSQAKFP